MNFEKNIRMATMADVNIKAETIHIYSPEEHKVGVWREYRTVESQQVLMEKPLYEETVDLGPFTQGIHNVNHNIPNVDLIFVYKAICNDSTTGQTIPVPFVSDSLSVSAHYIADRTKIKKWSADDKSQYNLFIVVQYTKTTDQWETS